MRNEKKDVEKKDAKEKIDMKKKKDADEKKEDKGSASSSALFKELWGRAK